MCEYCLAFTFTNKINFVTEKVNHLSSYKIRRFKKDALNVAI